MEDRLRELTTRIRLDPGDTASVFELVALHERLDRRIDGRGLREWIARLGKARGLRETLAALEKAGPLALEAAPALVDLVCSERRERYSAQAVLTAIGPGAIPELIRGLRDASRQNRAWLATILGSYGPASAPALPHLRRICAEIGDAPHVTVDFLIPMWRISRDATDILALARQALDQPMGFVLEKVAPVLIELGPEAAELLPRVLRATRRLSGCSGQLMRAALAMAPGDEKVQKHLIGLLDDREIELRSLAAEALASTGAVAIPPLLKALKRALPKRRRPIVEALARLGVNEQIESSLRDQLASENKALALSAAIALEPERGGPEALRLLIEALSDPGLAADAATALGQWGSRAEDAIPALITAVHARYGSSAKAARRALWIIAPERRDVLRACLQVPSFHRSHFDLVDGRLSALGSEARSAAPMFAELFEDPDPWIRVAAACEHFAIAADAEAVRGVFIEALSFPNRVIADFAIRALRFLREDGGPATSELLALLENDRSHRRRLIVETLASFGPSAEEAASTLAALARGEDELAARAAWSWSQVGGPIDAVLERLLALTRARDRQTRSAACEVLGALGGDAAPALEALETVRTEDGDVAVRYQAARAIAKLQYALEVESGYG